MRNRNYPYNDLRQYDSINQMILDKAERAGDKIAFQYMQKGTVIDVSYKQFAEEILKWGKYLNCKYGKNRHIAILGENSYLWLVIFTAIVMSGNVAVLLDKELDSSDLEELIKNSDSEVCFYSKGYCDIADEISEIDTGVDFVLLETVSKNLNAEEADWETVEKWDLEMNVEQLAAIFFTSGTSGQSKGVMLTQTNMIADINMACKNFVLEGNVLAVLPFHHAFGLLTAVLKPFNYEHTVFINSSLKTVKRDLLCAKPQTIMLVPLFVETFYKSIWQGAREKGQEAVLRRAMFISRVLLSVGIDVRKKLFKSVLENFGSDLEYIICGGAALPVKYIREFRIWGIEILNGYGITECSPVIAVNRNYFHRDGSVGQIVKGCEVRIADVEKNGIGEIQVKGSNVMSGYYNNPQATEDAFSDGWFKTGDLGYLDKEGFLYITGRKKNLIILPNGENVSPEELEQRIMRIAYVKEVLVSEKEGQICAEVFLDKEVESEAENRIHTDIMDLNRNLPNYKKIGKILIREEEFEKTTTRKIKRR